jgi:hypothetical protein
MIVFAVLQAKAAFLRSRGLILVEDVVDRSSQPYV